jgi:hypothetical protein
MKAFPTRFSDREDRFDELLAKLKNHPMITLENHDHLADTLLNLNVQDIVLTSQQEDLRYYHYVHPGEDVYFFTNESKHLPIRTMVQFKQSTLAIAYDALSHAVFKPHGHVNAGTATIEIDLEPYESIFLIFQPENQNISIPLVDPCDKEKRTAGPDIDGTWQISTSTAQVYPTFTHNPDLTTLGNLATPEKLPTFAGTIRYELEFEFSGMETSKAIYLGLGEVYEIAEVSLNNQPAGIRNGSSAHLVKACNFPFC